MLHGTPAGGDCWASQAAANSIQIQSAFLRHLNRGPDAFAEERRNHDTALFDVQHNRPAGRRCAGVVSALGGLSSSVAVCLCSDTGDVAGSDCRKAAGTTALKATSGVGLAA